MPLFVIIGHDVADSPDQRTKARPAHLERLKYADGAQSAHILLVPRRSHMGESAMSGSVVVAEFEDIHAAKAWAEADPYIIAGVYHHVDVRPFIQVLPEVV